MPIYVQIHVKIQQDAENKLYQKAIQAFVKEEHGGLKFEKLQGGGYSIRANDEVRLILVPRKLNGQSIWLWVATLDHHQYEKLAKRPSTWWRALTAETLSETVDPAPPTNILTPIETTLNLPTDTSSMQTIEFKVVDNLFFYNNEWICMDDEQKKISEMPCPAIITGVPGAGKSFLAFEKLKLAVANLPQVLLQPKRFLYVTQHSSLVEEIQTNWEEQKSLGYIQVPTNCRIEFKTTRQVARDNEGEGFRFFVDLEEKIKTDYLASLKKKWKQDHKNPKLKTTLPPLDDLNAFYQEIRAMSGYINLPDYQKNTGKHSLFPNELHQQWLWNQKPDTKKWLEQREQEEIQLQKRGIIVPPYDFIAVDETQLLWHLEIALLKRLAKEEQIFYVSGDNQNLSDSRSNIPFIKSLHLPHTLNVHTLQIVHRSPAQICEAGNIVLNLMCEAIDKPDHHQITSITPSGIAKALPGDVFWLDTHKQLQEILAQKNNNDNSYFAVVLPETFPEEKKRTTLTRSFANKNVLTLTQFRELQGEVDSGVRQTKLTAVVGIAFTPQEITGLGFKNVFLYEPLQHDHRFLTINGLLVNKKAASYPQAVLRPAFNALFTSCMRSSGNLLIFQPASQKIGGLCEKFSMLIKELHSQQTNPSLIAVDAREKIESFTKIATNITQQELVSTATAPGIPEIPSLTIRQDSLVTKKADRLQPLRKKTNETRAGNTLPALSTATASSSVLPKLNSKPASPQQSFIDSSEKLLLAIQAGDVGQVTILLQQTGANITINALEHTPLHVTAVTGHLDIAKLLIDSKAKVDAVTKTGLTPLHVAAHNGYLSIAELLITSHAEINAANEEGATPLHMAIQKGCLPIAKLLIDSKAEVNAVANNGVTPLQLAAHNGHLSIAELLITSQAEINAANPQGFTPLQLAALKGHLSIAELLINSKAEVNAVTNNGFTPLQLAAEKGHLSIAELLINSHAEINAANPQGLTPLLLAAQNGHLDIAKLLIDSKAEVNAFTKKGLTPLHLTAQNGHLDIAELLINSKAEVNAVTNNGFTPLQLAAEKGYLPIAKLLIDSKAEVNAVTNNGVTPLHVTAITGHLSIAKLLIDSKAKVNAVANNGFTPLLLAAGNGHLDIAKLLIDSKAEVNAVNREGLTPLHWAAQKGYLSIAELLINSKAEVNAVTNDGFTPLQLATHQGRAMISLLSNHNTRMKTTKAGSNIAGTAINLTTINGSPFHTRLPPSSLTASSSTTILSPDEPEENNSNRVTYNRPR